MIRRYPLGVVIVAAIAAVCLCSPAALAGITIPPTFTQAELDFLLAQNHGLIPPPFLASAGGPYTISLGDPLVLDGSADDPHLNADPLQWFWDLNNDGVFGDVTGPTPSLTGSQSLSFFPSPGLYPISLLVIDDLGAKGVGNTSATVSVVPEPASLLLLTTGLAGLAGLTWTRRRRVSQRRP